MKRGGEKEIFYLKQMAVRENGIYSIWKFSKEIFPFINLVMATNVHLPEIAFCLFCLFHFNWLSLFSLQFYLFIPFNPHPFSLFFSLTSCWFHFIFYFRVHSCIKHVLQSTSTHHQKVCFTFNKRWRLQFFHFKFIIIDLYFN